jgi:hypothetical protein
VGQFELRDKITARKGNRRERTMRAVILALGALILIAVVLFWPPAVIHISHTLYFRDIYVSISDLRAAILVLAVASFIAGVVSAVISAVRHRA